MTDEQIVKALECCSIGTFACTEECPCFYPKRNLKINSCRFELLGEALDLINRQKAESEQKDIEIDILIRKKETLRDEICELQIRNNELNALNKTAAFV